jgi:hypothetical protein
VATLSFGGGTATRRGRPVGRGARGPARLHHRGGRRGAQLQAAPGNGKLDVDGQIFPNDDGEPEAFGVQILSGTDEVGTTATDELGEFAFEGVAPGEYQILLSSEEVEILISRVELRA